MWKIALAVFILSIKQSTAGPGGLYPWGYQGDLAPENWPLSYPYCGGDTQSGIDIITTETISDPNICTPMQTADWSITTSNHRMYRAQDNGNSIAIFPHKLDSSTGEYVDITSNQNTIGKFSNQFNYRSGVNEKFCFHSFHFHWGTINEGGSEHNVNGLRYPLEGHFVHYSCDYDDLTEAVTSKNFYDKYVLGVVGILFELSNTENDAFNKILDAKVSVLNDTEYVISDLDINHLIPDDLSFYAYEGSLTTPPCSPVVRWHVMKETVKIADSQLKRLQDFTHSKRLSISKNYRPIQSNKNMVYDCTNAVTTGGKLENAAVSGFTVGLVQVLVLFQVVYYFF